ncbi:FimV family protein [Pseudomonas argentinensis]|uniref:Pilus assembly protein FimV n=1 Tax=Phytopseudomonas argentinensis TaxID=289370 RepID=A0A1I3H0U8_9GAMM|nr:FimV/HubP family polar landmark protein [Pseudomonas argentinensis]KAB0548750.1 FimV family protein [Pseudomonas argentinensis]SFI29140.1 pilus assembly protein FimV [Pseudomonas argentinensis]
MVRVRKLVLAIAAATALSSGMAHALGVGELTLQSSLNQPLVAEIELLDVRDLSAAEMRPSLASPEEFNKAGVDRQYFLTDLKFTPIVKPNGKSVIRVTSSKPVREPYLNFLVEVLWPNGRLLREYTLLLDPPLYSPQAAAAPQLPVAAPAPRPAPSAAPRAAAPSATPAAPRAGSASGGDYRTNANDTLWEVAQRAGGSGSVHQKMLAIQDLNPDAFIGGNINRMKSGQVLRLPDDQQIARRSQSEALAQVGEQNSAWRQGRSAPAAAGTRQIDATRRSGAGAAPAQVTAEDKLKLVAAEAGKATAGSESGTANNAALANQLAVTQESLDSTRRENDELKDRMGDLQSQLDKLQRLIQLKDNQLAKLQADVSAPAGQAADNAAAGAAAAPSAPVTPPAETPAAAAPAGEPPAANEAAPEPAPVDPSVAQPAGEPAVEAPAAENAPAPTPEAAAPAEPAAPAAEVPAQAPVAAAPEPVEEDSALDNLLANPMMLGLIGGSLLLALLLVLLILSRRNARKAEEEEASLAVYEEDTHRFDSDLELPADSLNELSDDQVALSQPLGEERVTAQTGDALGEADIYIAYGRFNQAAELLHNAINDEPQRTDLRLKLMEVYAELGDREGFARQENELREIGGANAQVEQLKSRYPAMVVLGGSAAVAAYAAADDLDSFSLDDLALDEPEPQLARQPAADDAFDLDLDALEAEFAADPQPKAQDGAASFDEIDTLSLDSDLDLPAEPPVVKKDDAVDFDLDLGSETSNRQELGGELADFNLDLDTPASPASAQDDDFLLSLDDEADKPAADLPDLSAALDNHKGDDFGLPADFDLSLADEPEQPSSGASFAAQLDDVTAELDQLVESLEQQGQAPQDLQAEPVSLDEDDDFDFLSGTDETATKLDLARAYIDMGDSEGARDILDEVIAEGNEGQQQEARELIGKLV